MQVLDQAQGQDWILYHGDSVEVVQGIPDNSVHFSVFSPPFASLYTYSNSDRDMGNCKGDQDFADHFQYLISQLYRVLMPGRLIAFHCMNLPTSKARDGYIGIKDFRGQLIRSFEAEGFIYHSEVTIWKDPVMAMQRTKAIGLLHKQLKKDSALSRQGIPDYLVVVRKPGDNPEPVAGRLSGYAGDLPPHPSGDREKDSINVWQRYASPVWMDINPNDTLQFQSARDNNDERHICPLQLQVIERAVQLWTNPGDTVLDPFNGIGSSGHVALRLNRRYVGVELKESYYRAAVNNLNMVSGAQQRSLFDVA